MYEIKQLDLDGIYRRVQRNGKWVNRCFSDLTISEQYEFLQGIGTEGIKQILQVLLEQRMNMLLNCLDDQESLSTAAIDEAHLLRDTASRYGIERAKQDE